MTNEELDALVARGRRAYPHDEKIAEAADALTALRAEHDDLRGRLDRAVHAGNVACEIADAKDAEVKRLTQRLRLALDRADAAEARVDELEAANQNYAEQLSSAVETAEAAALERAAMVANAEAFKAMRDGMSYGPDGTPRPLIAIRALITPEGRTALDAALADARKAGKLGDWRAISDYRDTTDELVQVLCEVTPPKVDDLPRECELPVSSGDHAVGDLFVSIGWRDDAGEWFVAGWNMAQDCWTDARCFTVKAWQPMALAARVEGGAE